MQPYITLNLLDFPEISTLISRSVYHMCLAQVPYFVNASVRFLLLITGQKVKVMSIRLWKGLHICPARPQKRRTGTALDWY